MQYMPSLDYSKNGRGRGDLHSSLSLPQLGSPDMRQQLFTRQPLSYKVGTSTLRVQTKFVTAVSLIGCGALLLLYVLVPSSRTTDSHHYRPPEKHGSFNALNYQQQGKPAVLPVSPASGASVGGVEKSVGSTLAGKSGVVAAMPCQKPYNDTYPLSSPILNHKRGVTRLRIAVVADLDTDSKHPTEEHTWRSYLKKGYLEVHHSHNHVQIWWDAETLPLSSHLSYGGRGLELSELVVYDGRLLSLDDRTGVVFELNATTGTLVPWVMLSDGDGRSEKGFKSEWATVREGLLYIGGLGKEWTSSTGEMLNHNPQWIKTVDVDGRVDNHDWTDHYIKIREAVGIRFPGYMIHEAVCWSSYRKEWLFLPRRASEQRYDEHSDERQGTNLMLAAGHDFVSVKVAHVGDIVDTHGFSSFKFIPGTEDELMVALKSEEVEGKTATYVMAFTRAGEVLLKETKIGDYKFEGIEFI